MTHIQSFLNDDQGAVTVDWVILCAGLVGLGLAVMTVVKEGTADISGDMNTSIKAVETQTTLDLSSS